MKTHVFSQEFEAGVLEAANNQVLVPAGDSDAWRLNRQVLLPFLPDRPVASEEIGRQRPETGVMNGIRGDGIAILFSLPGGHANVGTVKMEMWKVWVKSQIRRLAQNEYELIQGIDGHRLVKGRAKSTQANRV